MKRILFNLVSFSSLALTVNAQTPELGVHWGNAINGTAPNDFTTTLSDLNSNKIKWIRSEINWADIQTSSNTFIWAQRPAYLQALVDSGYSIIGILRSTPSWYTTNNTGNPFYDSYFAPQDTIEWVKFVDSTVTKFHNQIKYWEVWNEVDGGYFQTTTPSLKHIKYKNILSSAYRRIKNIDTSAQVLVGGFTTKIMSDPSKRIFLDSLFAINFQQYFDIMNIHVYEWAYELKTIIDTMQSKGIGNYPLWITETNPWRELDPNNSEINTANYLCNWIQDTLIPYFNPKVICWFNLRNFVSSIPAICDTCDPNLTTWGLLNSLYQPTLVLPAYENCFLTSSVASQNYSTQNISIYPNPFSNSTTVEITNGINTNYELKIYDVFGKEVRKYEITKNKTEISRENLPCGMYFYQVKDKEKNIGNGKIIIQ